MYIISREAGWGRNFWKYVDSGTVNVRTSGGRMCATIWNGMVTKLTTHAKGSTTTMTYGKGIITRKGNKTIKRVHYEPGTLQAIKKGGLWKKETHIQLCGSKGAVECYSTSNGAYGREVFTYENGVQGYVASRWRKQLKVMRPNGRPWIVITGKVRLSQRTLAERLNEEINDLDMWYWIRGNNWDITVYDGDGQTIATQGHIERRQKQGKWIERGKVAYYMSGVKVSQQLYEEDPAKWNAREVLHIPNAQLRCSLLNRMGYNKLLEKVKHRIICQGDDGDQLLEIDSGLKANNGSGIDNTMRLVKVTCPSTGQVYVLRVPPQITDYEQARQWTFGLQEASLQKGTRFELVAET